MKFTEADVSALAIWIVDKLMNKRVGFGEPLRMVFFHQLEEAIKSWPLYEKR